LEVYLSNQKKMAQEIIVYVIIAGAMIYWGYTFFRKRTNKKSNTCGDCTGCSCKSKFAQIKPMQ